MKKLHFLTFLILSLNLQCNTEFSGTPVYHGVADLSHANLNEKTVRLDGDWEFYWDRLYKPNDLQQNLHPDIYIKVPSEWNTNQINGTSLPGTGKATYKVKIKIPESGIYGFLIPPIKYSYKMWVNENLIAEGGKVGISEETSLPQNIQMVKFVNIPDKEFTITIQTANFFHVRGGITESLLFGKQETILLKNDSMELMDAFLFGILLIMGLYHLTIYLQRKEEKSSLHFGTFCVLIAMRIILMGSGLVYKIFPEFQYSWALKLEYLSYYLGVSVFLTYISHLFQNEMNRILLLTFQIIAAAFSLVVLFFPVKTFSLTLIPYQFITLAGIFVLFQVFFQSLRDKKKGTKTSMLGVTILIASVINDILYDHQIVSTGYIAPIGLALFIFVQSYTLARLYSLAFKSVENLAAKLTNTNQAYRRFVPQEFLSLLQKDDITRVKLGDQINKTMSIMFADIRAFTTISEKMSPEENFNFINSYLRQVGPIVRKHEGFIDKYIGDSIMALFPDKVDEAIFAAIEIQKEVEQYNQYQKKDSGQQEVHIGIGINSGNLMLGIIGEDERMDGTVISDTVNTASRLEGFTKIYHAKIIISDSTFNQLQNKENLDIRHIDRVYAKGKSIPIDIYEIFNNDSEPLRTLKRNTQDLFEEAVSLFLNKQYPETLRIMKDILEMNPLDGAAKFLMQKAKIFIENDNIIVENTVEIQAD